VNNLNRHTTYQRQDHVGIFTITNPPQNYLTDPEFIHPDFLLEVASDSSIKALIIKGAGRHFSAGADRNLLFSMSSSNCLEDQIERGKILLSHIEMLDIPVIAMIRGACFGGGLEIALACHIRICSENSMFAFPETGLGLIPGLGGTQRLSRLISKAGAIEMILGAGLIDAEKARQLRLVDHMVSAKDIESFTFDLIRQMTENRTAHVVRYAMRAINNSCCLNVDTAMKEETKLFCMLAKEEAKRQQLEGKQ